MKIMFFQKKDHTKQGKAAKERSKSKAAFFTMLAGSGLMLAVAVFCGVYFFVRMHQLTAADAETYHTYAKHYVLITDDTEKDFWNEVYDGASTEAKKCNAYVERLGEDLAVNYSTKDLLRMAIDSSVDGIIICGDDDHETVELINEAVEKGIFVVTLRQDVDGSLRQCFVGINNYDLGKAYGNQILDSIETAQKLPGKITILAENSMAESQRNIIALAIRDVLSTKLKNIPNIEIKGIDTDDAFSAEEAIRDIFIDEKNLPDVMVCLNSVFTQCCYQAAVDYNRVGDLDIIGYYASDAILEAISKNIVQTTISIKTKEMGQQAVEALYEYESAGYTNSYVPVELQAIHQKEAEELLYEQKK